MIKNYFVYILTNQNLTTFYVGVTSNLEARIYQHKNKLLKGFTEKYNLNRLVYFEETTDIYEAIKREKQLKKWKRDWKLELIRKENDLFLDLSVEWEY